MPTAYTWFNSPWLAVFGAFLVFVLLPFGLLFLVALARAARRWRAARRVRDGISFCVRCGYDLRGLDLPRCPECGVLRGFTVPLEDLGLTETEIRAGFARMRARRAADPGSHPSPPPAASP